jgi:hypothetical protein
MELYAKPEGIDIPPNSSGSQMVEMTESGWARQKEENGKKMARITNVIVEFLHILTS